MFSRRVWAMLIVVVFSIASPRGVFAQAVSNEPARAVMHVTHADIQGKVFIASGRQGEDEKPAPNVKVQVRDLDTGKILREAFTDKEGYYSLAILDPAQYLMIIGGFKIQLDVTPEKQAATELPKILIVILPEEMTRFRE